MCDSTSLFREARILAGGVVCWRVHGRRACDGHVPLPHNPVLHPEPIDKALKRVQRGPGQYEVACMAVSYRQHPLLDHESYCETLLVKATMRLYDECYRETLP